MDVAFFFKPDFLAVKVLECETVTKSKKLVPFTPDDRAESRSVSAKGRPVRSARILPTADFPLPGMPMRTMFSFRRRIR